MTVRDQDAGGFQAAWSHDTRRHQELKTWRGGPEAGKPKIPPAAKGLLERGLMRLDSSQYLPRLFFTEAGITALRRMMSDRRLADAKKFTHVRQELDIDPAPIKEAPQE